MRLRGCCLLALVVLALGAVAGCSGDDDDDTAATTGDSTASQYADNVCTAGNEWKAAIGTVKADLAPSAVRSSDDPVAYVRQVVSDAGTATRQLVASVRDATPP